METYLTKIIRTFPRCKGVGMKGRKKGIPRECLGERGLEETGVFNCGSFSKVGSLNTCFRILSPWLFSTYYKGWRISILFKPSRHSFDQCLRHLQGRVSFSKRNDSQPQRGKVLSLSSCQRDRQQPSWNHKVKYLSLKMEGLTVHLI